MTDYYYVEVILDGAKVSSKFETSVERDSAAAERWKKEFVRDLFKLDVVDGIPIVSSFEQGEVTSTYHQRKIDPEQL